MLALCFQVGSVRMAVDVRRIREVVPRVRLSPSVGGPHDVAGCFVYRGRIIPVIDLFRELGVGECPARLSSRIILLSRAEGGEDLLGLLATQVAEIRDIPTGVASGAAIADGSTIIHWFDPDSALRKLAPFTPQHTGAIP